MPGADAIWTHRFPGPVPLQGLPHLVCCEVQAGAGRCSWWDGHGQECEVLGRCELKVIREGEGGQEQTWSGAQSVMGFAAEETGLIVIVFHSMLKVTPPPSFGKGTSRIFFSVPSVISFRSI